MGSGKSFLTAVVDRNGNTRSLAYNPDNTVQTITDTQNRTVTFSYTQIGGHPFLAEVADWTGRNVQYHYNATTDNLTDSYDANGQHTVYHYNANGLLSEIDDALGDQTTVTYDAKNRVSAIVRVTNLAQGTGSTTSFAYPDATTTTVTDPDTNLTTYTYDLHGRVTQVKDAQNNLQKLTWTTDNQVLTRADAFAHTTTYTYSTDGLNNLTKVQLPQTTADQQHSPVIPNGPAVSWAYGDANHPYYPTTFTDAQNNTVTYAYGTTGNLRQITTPLTSQNQATINHNANGTIASVVDFNGNTTSYGYDGVGNLTKIIPPTIQAGQGTQLGATTITPDSLSRPGTIQDGKGQNTVYTYDPLDRTTNVAHADGSQEAMTLDADGNLTVLKDVPAPGQGTTAQTNFFYDLLNRQIAKQLPNQANNVCTVTVGGVTQSGTLCYTYDNASNLTAYLAAGASVANCNGYTVTICYGYNSLNLVSSIIDPANQTTTFGYDPNHQRTRTTYPGNTVQTSTYDEDQRLIQIAANNGSTSLTNYAYGFITNVLIGGQSTPIDTMLVQSSSQSDTAGHNASIVKTSDAMNRLKEWAVTVPQGSLLSAHDYKYTYDGIGNRTQIYVSPSDITNLLYNADNEWYQSTDALGNVNQVNWDAAGNMLGNNGFGGMSQPLIVTYNAKEQTATQTDDTQPTNVTWSFAFSGRGQWERTQKTSSLGTDNFTYSQLGLTTTDGLSTTYVRDPSGTLVSQQVSGGPYYYLSDGQGSVAGMADANGGQAAGYFYCPTGNAADAAWGSAASGNPFQDQSGYYDPAFKSYWMDGQQFDSNSGNAFALNLSPDQLQAEMLGMDDAGTNGPITPTLATITNPDPNQGVVFDAMQPASGISAVVQSCAGVVSAVAGGALGFVDTTVGSYVASRVNLGVGVALSPSDIGNYGLILGGTALTLAGVAAGGDAAVMAAGIAGIAGAAYAGYECGSSVANALTG